MRTKDTREYFQFTFSVMLRKLNEGPNKSGTNICPRSLLPSDWRFAKEPRHAYQGSTSFMQL